MKKLILKNGKNKRVIEILKEDKTTKLLNDKKIDVKKFVLRSSMEYNFKQKENHIEVTDILGDTYKLITDLEIEVK